MQHAVCPNNIDHGACKSFTLRNHKQAGTGEYLFTMLEVSNEESGWLENSGNRISSQLQEIFFKYIHSVVFSSTRATNCTMNMNMRDFILLGEQSFLTSSLN